MAKGKNKVDLEPDNISQLQDFTQKNPKYIIIHGLLSEDDDHKDKLKVYLNYELNTYVLIPSNCILRRERTKDDSGIELSVLYVERNIQVQVVQISSEQIESDF